MLFSDPGLLCRADLCLFTLISFCKRQIISRTFKTLKVFRSIKGNWRLNYDDFGDYRKEGSANRADHAV